MPTNIAGGDYVPVQLVKCNLTDFDNQKGPKAMSTNDISSLNISSLSDAHNLRIAQIAGQQEKDEKALGSMATQLEDDGRALASHAKRILTIELDMQKQDYRMTKVEEKVNVCGKFKKTTEAKMAGLQRLAASAAVLAMLDLVINLLQICGVV